MMDKIQKLGLFLEKVGNKVLLLIAFPVFIGLAYYSMRYTETLIPETEIPVTVADSTLLNLLVFIGVIAVFFLIRTLLFRKFKQADDKICRRLAVGVTVFVALISLTWVAICHVVPRADGSSVCLIAQLILEGSDFGFMDPPAYMSYNPHQYSLVAVVQLLFHLFGINNYQAFQYMNALCIPLLFYSGYRILLLIYAKWEPVFYYISFFVCCLPLFLYVPYVYGEITSTTFTMVLMWQVVRYCKTGKKSSFIYGTLAIVFACIMRMNSLIVLVAAGIVLLIYALRTSKWQAVAWLMAMVMAVFATDAGIRAYYEKISGKEVLDGIPYISYILMGLEDGESGPGWFNGTNYEQLALHGYDTELTAIDNTAAVKERLNLFWNDKAYGIDFFKRKVLSQWNSPAYHSLYETLSFDCGREELPTPVRRIYYDNPDQVAAFMNIYQFMQYICAAIMVTTLLFTKKQKSTMEDHTLIIAILGGFFFSILWEAMSRYVISYVVYMIPLAAVGMWQLQNMLDTAKKHLRQ